MICINPLPIKPFTLTLLLSIFFKCRLQDYCFFYLQVGQHMSCLKIRNKERQCLLHSKLHCIRCLFYSPLRITQMSGFQHTSKGNFESSYIVEFSTLLAYDICINEFHPKYQGKHHMTQVRSRDLCILCFYCIK